MFHTARHYWHVWTITALNAVQETFVNRGANILFFLGKAFRFTIMLGFLWLLKNTVAQVGGYTSTQMLAFYITYQLVDTTLQVFYRGVYEFGRTVRDGSFDTILTKPVNPLFRILTGSPDINDALYLVPASSVSIYLLLSTDVEMTLSSVVVYLSLLFNSFLIGTGLHIFIVSFTLLTTDVDNLIWIYRDVSRLGQFPITLYAEFFRLFLFFIIPIGIMVTIPAQALQSLPTSYNVILSFLVGISFFSLSLWVWQQALKTYSSASS